MTETNPSQIHFSSDSTETKTRHVKREKYRKIKDKTKKGIGKSSLGIMYKVDQLFLTLVMKWEGPTAVRCAKPEIDSGRLYCYIKYSGITR